MILSPFQREAIQGIEDGKNVLITAHTGSGKTLPAQYAIEYFTSKGKKVIYTSPIKALSNQKYSDFVKQYTKLEVGILTGDNKHNPSADVLIMTTEILYNKLLRKDTLSHLDFDMDFETELGCVIFDEVHYINDEDRGTIWEQSMMLLPNHVQMVMLSATIGNVEYISKWLTEIKGKDIVICGTKERVVPLEYYQYFTIPDKSIQQLTKKEDRDIVFKHYNRLSQITDSSLKINKTCIQAIKHSYVNRKFVVNELCKTLREKEMFPALFFVFSRKQVEELSNDITTPLFEENEKDYNVAPVCKQLLVSRVPNWKEYIILPEYENYVKLLEKGIGLHHAGMLPIFREMMEILYEQKYIKVLIATETFAIGLNMPTKTVCFTSLNKHDGNKYRMLYNNEFKQMCGRAGRRNIDKIGYVVLLTNLFKSIEPSEYIDLLSSKETNIKSKFKINYSFILHTSFTKSECIDYVKKSLMYMDIKGAIERSKRIINENENERPSMDTMVLIRCQEYESLKSHLDLVSNKKRKELQKKMKEYTDIIEYKEIYEKWKDVEKRIQDENYYKTYAESYIETKIEDAYRILSENGFMENNVITEKGKMACMMNEMHLLVFSDLYKKTNGFKEYTSSSLFSLLSCFYELKCEPVPEPEDVSYIKERMNYYEDQETKYGLSSMNQYNLQYVMYDYIRLWMECNDEQSCLHFIREFKSQTNLFIGDFVKCCLKLIHISNEITSICEYTNDYELLDKIKDGKHKIMKFIMTNQSLYL
jgi:superfamily II RNA helicase